MIALSQPKGMDNDDENKNVASPMNGAEQGISQAKPPEIKPLHVDVGITLKELMTALSKSQERVKQLTLKNMFLVQNLNELQSGFKVEQNLAKQQFESMKYNLMIQKSELQKELEGSSIKVTKYRETIMSKNKEINRLSRLLNQSQIHNPKLSRPNSMPTTSIRKPFFTRQLHSSDSNMLNTLGILASKVLKEEQNPQTAFTNNSSSHITQSSYTAGEEKIENPDNTESDISHDSTQLANQSQNFLSGGISSASPLPNSSSMAPRAQHFQSMPLVSEMRVDANANTNTVNSSSSNSATENHNPSFMQLNRPQLPNGIMLPKLRSFNTVDGTVKDVS